MIPFHRFSLVQQRFILGRALQYNLRLKRNRMGDTAELPKRPEPAKSGMEIGDILRILPHRYPFLLIDRVLELVRMKRIVALKNVTITEPFFQGHFPEKPIMPGVLIVEAIAQAGGLLLLTEVPNRDEMLMVFTGIEKARFRRPVVPGDQLRIEVEVGVAHDGGATRRQGVRRRQSGGRSDGDLPAGAASDGSVERGRARG